MKIEDKIKELKEIYEIRLKTCEFMYNGDYSDILTIEDKIRLYSKMWELDKVIRDLEELLK